MRPVGFGLANFRFLCWAWTHWAILIPSRHLPAQSYNKDTRTTPRVVIRASRDFKFSRRKSFVSWALSRQDKKIKINGIINGYVTFKYSGSYHKTLNNELLIAFFFLILIFSIIAYSRTNKLKKILFSNFRKNMTKPPLIWPIDLTL